jgi:protein-disulfide isomerase
MTSRSTPSRAIVLSLAVVAACSGGASATQDAKGALDPSVVADSVSVPSSPPRPTSTACSDARLALEPDTVVGRIDGKDITARELGPELAQAETQALHGYCENVASIRQQAFDRLVEDRLLAKAGEAEGTDAEGWMRKRIEGLQPPSEQEVFAYYEANRSPEAPPLEQIHDKVVQEMMRNMGSEVLDKAYAALRAEASVDTALPDVRPPAVEIAELEHTPSWGPSGAPVQVVEFSDFECPYCARAAVPVAELKRTFGDSIRFSFRHFPLDFHPNARPAAEHAHCAQEQGKFWEMHDQIFARASELSPEALGAAADAAGLDRTALDACLASGRAREQVEADVKKAREISVDATPTFYVNGRKLAGGPSELPAAIEAELALAGRG